MPDRPPRPCKICRMLTTNECGYCDEHKHIYEERQAMIRARHDYRRGSPSKRGYDYTWSKVRRAYLQQHPLCEKCEKEGRVMPAAEVHHIKPLAEGGDRLNPDNFMALCHACHQQITEQWLRERRGIKNL